MAYRVNAHFTDGLSNGWLSDVVAAPVPHCGETIHVNRYGREIAMCVTAVWTPSAKTHKGADPAIVMVEAREMDMVDGAAA